MSSTKDALQSFIFEHNSVRGYTVNLTDTYHAIISQRAYPSVIEKLLGEAMVGCVFLAASLKFTGKLTLQFHGDDRLPLLIVQCNEHLHLRAMAKYAETLSADDYNAAFLHGKLSLTLEAAHQPNAYQSIVPIHSSSMNENLMHYLTQSEQIPSQIWLASSSQQVAGMMLQLMPDKDTEKQQQFWEYAVTMAQTLQDEELLTLENEVLLHRLYHETDVRLFASRPVEFKCGCSEDKMKNVLLMLGEKEVQEILQQEGHVEINCDFCNQSYQFDSIDTAALFHPKTIRQGDALDPNVEIVKEIKSLQKK